MDYIYTALPSPPNYDSSNPLKYITDNGNQLIGYGITGAPTPFTREIIISDGPEGDGMQTSITIKSIVRWQEKGIDFDVELEDWYYGPVTMPSP